MADHWKKYPLLVVGSLPGAPPEAKTDSGLGTVPNDINNYYVVVSLPLEVLPEAIERLTSANLPPEQLVLHLPPDAPFRHPADCLFGRLDQLDGESPDELRLRLLRKLEGQRQKKLLATFREAQDGGLDRRFGEAELAQRLDALRVAHALACAYGIGPSLHGLALRACLAGAISGTPWAGEVPPERLIPEAALLLSAAAHQGTSLREAIRERAAGLSFRARTDLLHVLEICLPSQLGGRHAA